MSAARDQTLEPAFTGSYRKAAILGAGLIGASFGLGLKERGLAEQVVGLARRAATLEAARHIGAIDAGSTSLEEVLAGADLVVFAAPVRASIALLEQTGRLTRLLRHEGGRRPLLTDVCSTKLEIVQAAAGALPTQVDFIGGHPMAGGECSGPECARGDLFVGATWLLTPTDQSSPAALAAAERLAQALGARPLRLSPELHDRLVAEVSHLPHLLSVVLMEQVGEKAGENPELWQVAAAGFDDMTRLAAGSPEMWQDICLTNSANIADALEVFRRRLEKIEEALRAGEGETLKELLGKAQQYRTRLKE